MRKQQNSQNCIHVVFVGIRLQNDPTFYKG